MLNSTSMPPQSMPVDAAAGPREARGKRTGEEPSRGALMK